MTDMTTAPPLSASALAALLGARFTVAVAVPRLVNDQLYADERQHIARAVEKRQAEFGTARLCARRALAQLGVAPCSLVPRADHSPHWPAGVIGSISHTEGCCAVAVTKAPDVAGCGLDLERDTPLPPELEQMICTPPERAWLDTQAPEIRGWLGKLFFSAKEAFYKCQYRTTETLIDFQDVTLWLDPELNSFAVTGLTQSGARWDRVRGIGGRFLQVPGLIVTAAILNSQAGRDGRGAEAAGLRDGGAKTVGRRSI
jgi:4'-phosphopantetheinyl transferase EntD